MPTIKGVKRGLSGSIKLGQDKVISTYSLLFIVIADSTDDGPIAIRSTSGLPLVGLSTYSFRGESDTTAICKTKTPRQDEKQAHVWYVTCEFDNDPTTRSDNDESSQPAATSRPPIISWDSEYAEIVMEKDLSDTPNDCVNTVGDKFDPPLTRPIFFPVLVVRRYQATFSVATKLTYENKTNSGTFYTAPQGMALMTSIRANEVVEDAVKIWEVEFRVRFATEAPGHDYETLNQGPRYRKTAGGEIIQAIGNRNLNADGTEATLGSLHYVSFRRHKRVDFSPLGL